MAHFFSKSHTPYALRLTFHVSRFTQYVVHRLSSVVRACRVVQGCLRGLVIISGKEKGFIVLFWGDAGWVRFFSKKPAMYPDDFKQMKLFALANHPKSTELWKHAGFRVVELEVTDILTGLNTGLIDAVPSEPYYALAGQFYGPAPYMLDVKWAPLPGRSSRSASGATTWAASAISSGTCRR